MCTVFEDSDHIFNSLCAGATGYILKNTSPEKLIEAIYDVMNGGSPMSAVIARKVVSSFQPQAPRSSAIQQLSNREREILDLLAKGFRYKEIADKLFISTETVRTHIRNIYEKLQVQSRTEALNKVYFR
jgi:DNA-binding NarL/FixJ family response regulator